MRIDLTGVQQTLLIPLWSRAKLSREGNSILNDPKAIEIVENLQYDFETLDKNLTYFNLLMNVVRAKMFDDSIKTFMSKHTEAVVVNLGCGLDTTFFRVDNGSVNWYDIDLPDVIEIRKSLIPETHHSHCIAQSIFDMKWTEEIDSNPNDILFFSGAVLAYFHENVVKRFFSNMADHFPGSEIVFDTLSRMGRFFANRAIKHTGMKSAAIHWAISDASKIPRWNGRIEVLEQYPIFSRIRREDSWGKSIINQLDRSDKHHGINMVHMRLLSL